MALNLCYLLTLSLFILLPFFANGSPSDPVSPGTICKSTPNPSYCRSMLPNRTANVYDFGRFSVGKSLSQSQKFLDLVEEYLDKYGSLLSISAIRALEDCRSLADRNLDFSLSSFKTVNATSETLTFVEADDIQTFLSAILTNQQTCLDGILSTDDSGQSIRNGLMDPLLNDTKLHSVSLALFTMGWVPKKKKPASSHPSTKQIGAFKHRRLLMSNRRLSTIYETVSRRRLLQTNETDDDLVKLSKIVMVCQDGTGDFTTINDAISAAPNNTNGVLYGHFLIYITAGVYQEYISIPKYKKYLMMVGDGINQTIITGNRSVVDGWTTFDSATLAVAAPNFIAVNITFQNTAGAIKHQAVAVRSSADLSAFYSCSFEGYQDTLYTHSLRQFYRECDIYGTVDFIFGNAAVVLQNCNIYPRRPMSSQYNAITAQGRTDPNQNTGTSIHDCDIKAADDLASSNVTFKTYLGRPWKEYSRTVYMQSFMDSLIYPSGWREWSGDFALSTLYYAEYDNYGPGSNTSSRVTWTGYHVINATDAANFTVSSLLLGDAWLPDTGVPYDDALLI